MTEPELQARLQGAPPALLRVNLTLQPCSGDHCLQAETLALRVMTQAPDSVKAIPRNA